MRFCSYLLMSVLCISKFERYASLRSTTPHTAAASPIRRRSLGATAAARFLAFAVLVIISATTIALVIFASRAGLSANQEVVEVLHLCGARDGFIAAEIQRHFFDLGWRGGLIGFGLALFTFLLMEILAADGALFLVPLPSLSALHYLWLMVVPAALALVVAATARFTVLRVLGRMM